MTVQAEAEVLATEAEEETGGGVGFLLAERDRVMNSGMTVST